MNILKFHEDNMNMIMDSILKKEDKNETCPEGLCDGSGFIDNGQFDDMHETRCLCNREESMVESMDDGADNLK